MSRRRSWRSALPVVVLPLVAVLLVVVAAAVGPASSPSTGPRDVPVTSSTAACTLTGGLVASVGQSDPASATQIVTTASGETTEAELDAAQWHATAASGETATVRHEGTGGVEFVAGAHSSTGGLVVAACPRVTDETWYLGAGTSARHASELVLTNVADVVASVDIELWGPAGPIDAVDETGIVIDPGATRRVKISDLAVGSDDVAIRVVRTRGAVTATLLDVSTSVMAGTEVLASAGEPATETVLPGVAAAGTRTLLLANPGDSAASVTVHQSGAEGTFVPEGLDQVAVPAGSVVAMPLPAGSGTEATALRVASDEPVLAVVRVAASDKDFAYATGATAWEGPVVVPVATGTGPIRPVLLLLADVAETEVTVEAFDAQMNPVGQTTVTVGPQVQTGVDLADAEHFASPDVAYAVVTATAPVHATAVYRVDNLIALLALGDVPLTARGPHVQPGF